MYDAYYLTISTVLNTGFNLFCISEKYYSMNDTTCKTTL